MASTIFFFFRKSKKRKMSEFKEEISFVPVDKMTVGLLRRIHHECLPVHYNKSIYYMFAEGKAARGHLAYMNNDVPVGEICYRIEEDEKTKSKKLYLMTIGVLKAYRHRGIASKLLNKVLDEESKNVDSIYLHVLTTNESAIQFYTKNGFTRKEFIKNYYTGLDMGDAYVYAKDVTH